MSEINCDTISNIDSIIFCQEFGLKKKELFSKNNFFFCTPLKYMKIIKLIKANKFINKKLVIEKSRVIKLICINCNISNCSRGACNIYKLYFNINNCVWQRFLNIKNCFF